MITTTTASLVVLAIATVLGVIGYFLRIVHTDVRKVVEEQGKLKGKIELVEQESRLKYQAIQEQTQIELKNLAKNIGDLTDTVRQLVTIR
jgi:uncharacterized protein YsxB (DUF464 family)